MKTPRALQMEKFVPMALRSMIGATHAMTTALSVLVLVTSLVPVFAVCIAALGAPQPDRGRLRRSSGSARESA